MNTNIVKKVVDFLISNNIKCESIDTVVSIDRDNIVEYIDGICPLFNEEECYEEFLQLLIEEFGERFFYSMKSDTNLYLDMIEG
ncbi:MAG: hypothetical protein M0Q13_12935 [Methanothrix sp.]|jgi:hypothetical protein|nr:hypothetical protein [Methanothrix sp.]